LTKEFLQGADEQVRLDALYSLPEHVVQVVNTNTGRGTVHLFSEGPRTVCGAWRCGAPDYEVAGKGVSFAIDRVTYSGLTSSYRFCRPCYSEISFLKIGAERISPLHPESSSSGESSYSDASSASSLQVCVRWYARLP
jgi:hypothetical protein